LLIHVFFIDVFMIDSMDLILLKCLVDLSFGLLIEGIVVGCNRLPVKSYLV